MKIRTSGTKQLISRATYRTIYTTQMLPRVPSLLRLPWRLGVGLLCQLVQMWGKVAAGMVTLIEWLLGDEQSDTSCEESLDLDEDFLFEKGDRNLWAEPLLWARMLHRHLSALVRVTHCSPGVSAAELDRLSVIAKSNTLAAQHSMKALPALPQFFSHHRVCLLKERTSLAQNLLDTLRS